VVQTIIEEAVKTPASGIKPHPIEQLYVFRKKHEIGHF